MPTECNPELFAFAPVEGRPVVAAFDGGRSHQMLVRCCWVRRIVQSA